MKIFSIALAVFSLTATFALAQFKEDWEKEYLKSMASKACHDNLAVFEKMLEWKKNAISKRDAVLVNLDKYSWLSSTEKFAAATMIIGMYDFPLQMLESPGFRISFESSYEDSCVKGTLAPLGIQ